MSQPSHQTTRWIIQGRNLKTGRGVRAVVDGADERAARKKAANQGIQVESIQLDTAPPPMEAETFTPGTEPIPLEPPKTVAYATPPAQRESGPSLWLIGTAGALVILALVLVGNYWAGPRVAPVATAPVAIAAPPGPVVGSPAAKPAAPNMSAPDAPPVPGWKRSRTTGEWVPPELVYDWVDDPTLGVAASDVLSPSADGWVVNAGKNDAGEPWVTYTTPAIPLVVTLKGKREDLRTGEIRVMLPRDGQPGEVEDIVMGVGVIVSRLTKTDGAAVGTWLRDLPSQIVEGGYFETQTRLINGCRVSVLPTMGQENLILAIWVERE